MIKKNPFMIASLIFGGLALLLLITAALSLLWHDTTISNALAKLFHMSQESFTNETIGQLSVVLFVPAFIFAYRSLDNA